MKVTVIKNINVRVGKPSLNAPCYQYLAPGSELEVDGKLYSGDKYDGNDQWYKDAAGNYYWSGGVELNQIQKQEPIAGGFSKFFQNYAGNGTGVGVAILDSGVDVNQPFLKGRIQKYDSFLEGKSIKSISSHGTKVAGIIASDDPNLNRNKSEIYCFRVADKSNTIDSYAVELALEHIDNNKQLFSKIQVINLSLDIIPDYITRLQPIVDSLATKGIAVVVAAGENKSINNIASLNGVIKVGVFDKAYSNTFKSQGLPKQYDLAFLNEPIPSYDLNGTEIDTTIAEDSAYCALVSSLIAREFSQTLPNKNQRVSEGLKYLKGISTSIRKENSPQIFKPYIT